MTRGYVIRRSLRRELRTTPQIARATGLVVANGQLVIKGVFIVINGISIVITPP